MRSEPWHNSNPDGPPDDEAMAIRRVLDSWDADEFEATYDPCWDGAIFGAPGPEATA